MERIVRPMPLAGAGKPIEEYLAARFTYLSRAEWDAAVAEGALSLNGRRAEPDQHLSEGDLLRFDPEDFSEPQADETFSILHEDEDLLIVDKPANLAVHPAGRFFKRTLWYLLRASVPDPRILTRLDRETSGVVVVAKTAEEARRFQALAAAGTIDKKYLALTHGSFSGPSIARGALVPDPASAVRKKLAFVGDGEPGWEAASKFGKTCETRFRSMGAPRTGFSLLEATS
jgi:23S rRNA-/tRNA-specific pseudouridylate synthase